MLNWDCTLIGTFDFSDFVKWWYPVVSYDGNIEQNPFFMAKILIKNVEHCVYIKRVLENYNDQILYYDIKPTFGLINPKIHIVRLTNTPIKKRGESWLINGHVNYTIHNIKSNFFVYPAQVIDGEFVLYKSINEVDWIPKNIKDIEKHHIQIYNDIQRILLFYKLFRIPDFKNILYVDGRAVSYNEENITHITKNYKWCGEKVYAAMFPYNKESIACTYADMLNVDLDDPYAFVNNFYLDLEKLVHYTDLSRVWICKCIRDELMISMENLVSHEKTGIKRLTSIQYYK